jgi:SAM-dependent methyltransferase
MYMTLTEDVARYYSALADKYDVSAGYVDSSAEGLRARIKRGFREALKGHDVLEIACGTGYWTEVISGTARSVLATDVDLGMISIARGRLCSIANVRCQVADAYSLDGISGRFTAAFAHWWWSHVPKSRIGSFLSVLHSKLMTGALVLFADQLLYEWETRWRDEEGNLLEQRVLPNGYKFSIVKNFPTEEEVIQQLGGMAENITYREYAEERSWVLSYNTKATSPSSG